MTQHDEFRDRIYYADQSGWNFEEWQELFAYLHRLILFVGPTPEMIANPDHRASRIQAKRTGQQDEELSAMDPARMSVRTRWLLKHMLISQKRYELALEKFPNLRPLSDTARPEDLPIVIDPDPLLPNAYLMEHGIIY